MAARIAEGRVVLDEVEDIAAIVAGTFPVIGDFEVRLRDAERFGMHLDFASTSRGRLAGFPWWDHADADLREMSGDGVPIGTIDRPFSDVEQGWQILIWEHDGHVLVMEGDDESVLRYQAWFTVPKELYLSAWLGAIERARSEGGAFKSLADALQQPDKVRVLELGNQKLSDFPLEICSFQNLESLNLYLNQVSSLPPGIGRLKRLRWLDLRFNRIEALPDELALLESLEEINLAENRLGTIPSWVAVMPKLKTLYVSGNPVSAESMDWIRRTRPGLDLGPR
jgi:hypothetical protein